MSQYKNKEVVQTSVRSVPHPPDPSRAAGDTVPLLSRLLSYKEKGRMVRFSVFDSVSVSLIWERSGSLFLGRPLQRESEHTGPSNKPAYKEAGEYI